ncbi:MAG: glycosyltransferase family 2 protein, partial [Thermodesulfobacteriota bacterium]
HYNYEMSSEDYPLISVIILNWNGKHFLQKCIVSVLNQTYPNLEIIVVDNASTDDSLKWLTSFSNQIKVVYNFKNLGYGGGNNRGIKESKGSYLLILNNDTELERDCIEKLWRPMVKEPRIGVTTPKILFSHKRNLIDAAGLTIYWDGLSIGRGHLESEETYSIDEEVFFGSGCASLLKREMLEEIGLFDEDFFAYADDTDLGWRARQAGWKSLFVPNALVFHHHSGKFGNLLPYKAFLLERNRIWVALKNFPIPLLILLPYSSFIRYLFQGLALIFHKKGPFSVSEKLSLPSLILIIIKAYLSAFMGLPEILKKRKEIKKIRKICNKDYFTFFKRFGISAREIAVKS